MTTPMQAAAALILTLNPSDWAQWTMKKAPARVMVDSAALVTLLEALGPAEMTYEYAIQDPAGRLVYPFSTNRGYLQRMLANDESWRLMRRPVGAWNLDPDQPNGGEPR